MIRIVFVAFVLLFSLWGTSTAEEGRTLRFGAPASHFTESCVLGSGRLGAMVFGGVKNERIVLNESGMWSGSPQEADKQDAFEALPEIRRLLLAGKNFEAEQLVNQSFTCIGKGSGRGGGKSVPYGCYQTLGDLRLTMHHDASASDYERELRLADARATVAYTVGSVRYTREAFASAPDEVIVVRITADTPGSVSFDAALDRPERRERGASGQNEFEMHGQLEDGLNGTKGVRWAARLRVDANNGEVSSDDKGIHVRGADSAVLLLSAATDIKSFAGRKVQDARATAASDIEAAASKPFSELASRQTADHLRYFGRADLRLGQGSAELVWERLQGEGPPEPDLVATLFDYGRYLLVSSSRPGGFPANLQGVWAEEVQTPWNGDWHANVNIQMNYWPADPTALGELNDPLVALIDSLVEPGQRTAKAYYGARGWVAHLLLNPWGYTSPGESASWGSTPTCSAWLCQHLWDHYLFTGDREYLRRVYPTLRGAAEFYSDMLIEEPTNGWLVTAPSNSPENAFVDAEGRTGHTCMGPAMDQQLLRYLFDAVVQADALLGEGDPLVSELREKRERLAPTQISSDGRVMEWLTERQEADPHHRHVSHLWGLYPGMEINRLDDHDLAAAARKTLDARGDGGTGWAIAHKACLWARLGDGDRALKLLNRLLLPVISGQDGGRWKGGVYPNLLVAHPPFQIDGNFGATAAVAEMLVQSRYDEPDGRSPCEVDLLPALPSAWSEGSVRGLRARGRVEVDIAWAEGNQTKATLTSRWANTARVRYGEEVKEVDLPIGEAIVVVFD